MHSRYHPGYQETIRRVHDGAIGEIVAIEENFLRGPYGLYHRASPSMNEVEYQFSNQYHFTWLSGDDVTQSLVHNVDRATWAMHEQTPVKAHGLGGRSASFGDEIYGNVFDHHSVVYEYANGVRMYAFCRTAERLLQRILQHHPRQQGPLQPDGLHASRARPSGNITAQAAIPTTSSTRPCFRPSARASRSTPATTWPAARWSP